MIFDCVIMFDELDLLEIRLHELSTVVDMFVIIEGDRSFSHDAKRLHFRENEDRFKGFKERIIYFVVEDYDSSAPMDVYERECILQAIGKRNDNDRIMVSDCDEIPSKEAVTRALRTKETKIFSQEMCCYWVDYRCKSHKWSGTRMSTYENIRHGRFDIRRTRSGGGKIIQNGGWHFSYLGGVGAIQKKIWTFGPEFLVDPCCTERDHIKECMEQGRDIFLRDLFFQEYEGDYYPEHLVNNSGRFSDYYRKKIEDV